MYDCAMVSVILYFYVAKKLRIILPKGICTPEGCKFTFIDNLHNENYRYADIHPKEDKTGFQKSKDAEREYIKYQ